MHTVYGGAQLYKAETTSGSARWRAPRMDAYGAHARGDFAARRRLHRGEHHGWLAHTVYERVRRKLEREPVEDFRIDFEDGFGARPDAEEDATAATAAREVARGLREGLAAAVHRHPHQVDGRGMEGAQRAHARDLPRHAARRDRRRAAGRTSCVTLPKVTVAEQPRTLVRLFEILERRHGLAAGTLRMELMVEVTQAIIGADGRSPLPGFLAACEGRCVGAHFGTYDYTASCNVTAAFQVMDHPMVRPRQGAHAARLRAAPGIFLSDGSTNVLPVGPHAGKSLTEGQRRENRAAVHHAWQLSHRHIRHSLEGGFYQGWDLHPAQIPVRFATCYAFFLEGFAPAADRLRNFVEKAAQATLVGDVFDDAATGQGLLNYFLRALNSGAIEVADLERTGPDAGGGRAALVREDPRRATGAAGGRRAHDLSQRRVTGAGSDAMNARISRSVSASRTMR